MGSGCFPLWLWLWESVKLCSPSIPSHCSIQLEFSGTESLSEGKRRWRKESVFLQRTLFPVAWLSGGRCISKASSPISPLPQVWDVCTVDQRSDRDITHIQSALHIHGFCTHGVSQPDGKYLGKIPESCKKHSLNLPHTSNYFTLYLRLFT